MKKLKLYLDTSIINWCISEDANIAFEKDVTLKVVQKINDGEYEGYISSLVIAEIEKSPVDKRKKLDEFLKQININVILVDKEIEALADKYVNEGIIPVKYRDDAVHMAAATVYDIEVILSWNFEHMVKLKTKRGVKAVNELMGYRDLENLTPEEMD